MKWLSAKFRLLNILNLDVAAGAAGMAIFVNHIFQQQIPWTNYYLLFSVVWTIYLLDHLYDSKKPEAISERRKFFKTYHRVFWVVLIVNVLVTLGVFISQFNVLLLLYALPALGITGVYMLANWLFQENKQKFYLKEILISMGYALGVMVIPMSTKRVLDAQAICITVLMTLMALWNLLLIARFERFINEKEGQTSMSQWVSLRTIQWINYVIYGSFIGGGIWYGVMFGPTRLQAGIYLLMALYMLFPLVFPRLLRKKERYHRYVDMVFLLSFLCLLAPFN
jgi:hypothetical protein